MEISLPSLSTDRHFLFIIGFGVYPIPDLTHLNAKLLSLVAATLTSAVKGKAVSSFPGDYSGDLSSTTHEVLHLLQIVVQNLGIKAFYSSPE